MDRHDLEAFRYPKFRRVWGAGVMSQLGDWMQVYGRGILAYALTGNAGSVGLVVFFTYLPQLLFNFYPGVFADRFDRRRLFLVTQVAQATGAAILAVLVATDRATMFWICTIAFVMGFALVIAIPAEQALAPQVVPRGALSSAISLSAATNSLCRVFGPLLAAGVFALGGLGWVFAVNALSFSGVILVWLFTRVPPNPEMEEATNTAALVEGVRYVRRTARVWIPIAIAGFLGSVGVVYQPMSPVYAHEVLAPHSTSLGDAYNGWIQAAIGTGAAVGILGLAGVGRRRPGATLVVSAVLFSIALIALGFVTAPVVALPLLAVLGGLQFANMALAINLVQHEVPEVLRGRVMAVQMMTLIGFVPVAALVGGLLADRVGIGTVFAGAGVICLVFSLFALRWIPRLHGMALGARSDETTMAVTHVMDEES